MIRSVRLSMSTIISLCVAFSDPLDTANSAHSIFSDKPQKLANDLEEKRDISFGSVTQGFVGLLHVQKEESGVDRDGNERSIVRDRLVR